LRLKCPLVYPLVLLLLNRSRGWAAFVCLYILVRCRDEVAFAFWYITNWLIGNISKRDMVVRAPDMKLLRIWNLSLQTFVYLYTYTIWACSTFTNGIQLFWTLQFSFIPVFWRSLRIYLSFSVSSHFQVFTWIFLYVNPYV
jgi:hypothetical protein